MERISPNDTLSLDECRKLRASYDKEEQTLIQNLRAVRLLQQILTLHIQKLCAEAEKISPEDVDRENIRESIDDFNRRYPRSEKSLSIDDEDFNRGIDEVY